MSRFKTGFFKSTTTRSSSSPTSLLSSSSIQGSNDEQNAKSNYGDVHTPSGYLNVIYEDGENRKRGTKSVKTRPQWNSSFTNTHNSTSKISRLSSPSSKLPSSNKTNRYVKNGYKTKDYPKKPVVKPISSKFSTKVISTANSSSRTRTRKLLSSSSSSTASTSKSNAAKASSSLSLSHPTSTATSSLAVTPLLTISLPSLSSSSSSSAYTVSSSGTTQNSTTFKQTTNNEIKTSNNHANDNMGFIDYTYLPNVESGKQNKQQQQQQQQQQQLLQQQQQQQQLQQQRQQRMEKQSPSKPALSNSPKTTQVTSTSQPIPSKAGPKSITPNRQQSKNIYSLAEKVPMSYNIRNGLKNQPTEKLSSLSTSSLLSSSTAKTTSDYSSSSSMSHSSSSSTASLSLSTASSLTDSTSLSSKRSTAKTPDDAWLSKVETTLKSLTPDSTHVTTEQVKNALEVKKSFVSDRFIKLLDKGQDGQIEVEDLMDGLRALVNGTQEEKLHFLFKVYNENENGKIKSKEMLQFFTKLNQECCLNISPQNIKALNDAFFHAADSNKDGTITFKEMQTLVERRKSLLDNITICPADASRGSGELKSKSRYRYFTKTYIRNNLKKIITLIIIGLINLGLMGLALCLYWDKNIWVKIARCNGQALNFNSTLVLVLMLRRTLTWLRNTPLMNVLPFDQHVLFHRLTGYTIVLMGVGHTVGHMGNCVVVAMTTGTPFMEQMFTTKAGVGWIGHSAYITGDILFVVMFIMLILSLPMIRQSGNFEVFYWSHKLYLVFWAVLILHAPNFWKWIVVPGTIFILEMITRQKYVRSFYMGKTYIESVSLHQSDVTHLVITRPPSFHFKPGDYIFIQVPVIAKYEWHPFTISSAPENMDELWIHVRIAGHWTRSLHKYFVDYKDEELGGASSTGSKSLQRQSRRRSSSLHWMKGKPRKAREINAESRKNIVTKGVKVLIHIDGPYGTPSRHIFHEEHAVLIGSGIGITPFASILQSIVARYKALYVECPRCEFRWCHQMPASVMRLKKVDFVWIIRDQRHVDWFTFLLRRLEHEQEVEGGLGGILNMHIYMTSVPAKTDMRGMGLQLALDLVHKEEQTDLLTGLKTRTKAGRPDFEELFSQIKQDSDARRVKVFFCGSPLLGNTLKLYSHQFDFDFAHEYF